MKNLCIMGNLMAGAVESKTNKILPEVGTFSHFVFWALTADRREKLKMELKVTERALWEAFPLTGFNDGSFENSCEIKHFTI